MSTASNPPTGDVLTVADIIQLRARLKPCRFPFRVYVSKSGGSAVLVVATDEQIARAELNVFLRRKTSKPDRE